MAERDLFSMPSGLVPKPSPSAQGRKPPSTVGEKRKTCNCRNSRCLKLYCECFASGQYCYGCNCQSCFNNPENDELRKQAIESTLERNQQAFRPKISSTEQAASAHNRGCNCKKSGCLKKYCECYQAGIKCADTCKCVNCLNRSEGQKVVLPSPAPKRQRSATGAAAVAGATPASRLGSASDGLITPRAASEHLSAGHRMAISRSLLATPTAPALPTPLQLARVAIGECLTDEVLEGLYGALLDPEIAAMDLEQQEAAVLSLVHRALHQALSAARRAASHHLPTASAAPSVVSSSSGAVTAMPTPAPVTAHVPMAAPAACTTPACLSLTGDSLRAGSTSAVTGAVQAGAVTGAVQAAVHWPHSRAPAAEFRAAVAAAAAGTDAAPTTGNGGAVVSNRGAVVSNGGAVVSTGGAAPGATGSVCSSGGLWKRVTTAAAAATATAAASSTAAATTSGGGRPVPWAPIVTPAIVPPSPVPPSQPPLSVATAATAAAAAAATAAATNGGFAPLALSGAAMPGTGAVSGTIHGAVSGTVHRAVSGTPSGAGSGTVGGAVSGTASGVSYAGGTSRTNVVTKPVTSAVPSAVPSAVTSAVTKPVPSAVPSASKGGVQWLSMPAASSVAASGPERSRPNDIRNLVPMYQLPSSSTAPPTAAIAATMQQPPTLSTSAAPTHPPTSAAAPSPRQPQPHRK